jgi:RNA polymerase sigma-70 factor (ECF subfamily)
VVRSDRELVRASRHGDKEAFRELVERYQRKVVSVALGMVHNREDAIEIAQETFVKAFENLRNFKGDSSFYTWLYRIVVNLAIDFQRRERRRPTVGRTVRTTSERGAAHRPI